MRVRLRGKIGPEKAMVVYCAENKKNGNAYIGSTINNLHRRRSEHLYQALVKHRSECPYFHKALRKYGRKNFLWSVLGTANSEKALRDLETFWIKKLKPKYNAVPHGYGGNGGRFSKTGLKNIADTHRGNSYRLGATHTKATRKRLRQVMMDNPDHWIKYGALGSRSLARAFIDERTGTVYTSRRLAALKLGLPKDRVRRILNGSYSGCSSIPLRYLTEIECNSRGVKFNPPFVWSKTRIAYFTKIKQRLQNRPVICLEDDKLFPSLAEAARYYKMDVTKRQVNTGHNSINNGRRWFGRLFVHEDEYARSKA